MSRLNRSHLEMLNISRCVGKGSGVLLGAALLILGNTSSLLAAPLTSDSSPQTSPNAASSSDDVIIDTQPGTKPNGTPNETPLPGSTRPTGTIPSTSSLGSNRFSCEMVSGQYTVVYHPQTQPGQSYPWAVPSAMGGGWDSARRCTEISRRLELYRADGLQEMQTAVENGYNTVCVTTQRVSGCRIVLTVPRGQDPLSTRDRVFQNLTIADSGQQTQGVNTFVQGNQGETGGWLGTAARALGINIPGNMSAPGQSQLSATDGINLRPFLDRADGGTGLYLTKAAASRPGRQLNPNRFR